MMALNRVHRQRIGLAVDVAETGREVVFSVALEGDGGFGSGARLCWRADRLAGVIANGGRGALEALLPVVQEEFQNQLVERSAAQE